MSEVMLAFLLLDGKPRQTCVGCSDILLEKGMIEIVEERPMEIVNVPDGLFCSRIYQIRKPFSLAGCQVAVRERHVGKPWGEVQ